jgi:hypothetical protein
LKHNKKPSGLAQARRQPRQVGLRAVRDRQYQKLGNFVGVKAGDGRLHFIAVARVGFDQEKAFGGGFDRTLPSVNRLHAGKYIHAGGKLQFDQAMGNAFRLFAVSAGAQNDLKIRHRFNQIEVPMFTKYGSFDPKQENFPLREEKSRVSLRT